MEDLGTDLECHDPLFGIEGASMGLWPKPHVRVQDVRTRMLRIVSCLRPLMGHDLGGGLR